MKKPAKCSSARHAAAATPAARPEPMDCRSLHQAIHRLGQSLSERPWKEDALAAGQLLGQVHRVRCDLHDHCADIESPNGFFQSMCQDCPRLLGQVQRLCAEHAALDRQLGELEGQLQDAPRLSGAGPGAVGQTARLLMEAISAHDQATNNLVLEAYNTDLGVGD